MRFSTRIFLLAGAMYTTNAGCNMPAPASTTPTKDSAAVRLVTVDPGHFHAALVSKINV